MVGAMLFDKLNTVVGQPSTYWQQPETVNEGNPFFRYFLAHGLPVYVLFSLVYVSLIFVLVSLVPRRLALMVIFAFIFSHYYGASTWLYRHWHFGVSGPIIYGLVLAGCIVFLAFPRPPKPNIQ